jgi:hypothetical protein
MWFLYPIGANKAIYIGTPNMGFSILISSPYHRIIRPLSAARNRLATSPDFSAETCIAKPALGLPQADEMIRCARARRLSQMFQECWLIMLSLPF